jgi:hypothetical protein
VRERGSWRGEQLPVDDFADDVIGELAEIVVRRAARR